MKGFSDMSRILIRFNTKFEDDPQKRKWRVLEDGVEKLAHKVLISTDAETIQEDVDGIPKYHIMCHGSVHWTNNDVADVYEEASGWHKWSCPE